MLDFSPRTCAAKEFLLFPESMGKPGTPERGTILFGARGDLHSDITEVLSRCRSTGHVADRRLGRSDDYGLGEPPTRISSMLHFRRNISRLHGCSNRQRGGENLSPTSPGNSRKRIFPKAISSIGGEGDLYLRWRHGCDRISGTLRESFGAGNRAAPNDR